MVTETQHPLVGQVVQMWSSPRLPSALGEARVLTVAPGWVEFEPLPRTGHILGERVWVPTDHIPLLQVVSGHGNGHGG